MAQVKFSEQELRILARLGARARLEEIERERQSILKAFPDLANVSAPARRSLRRQMTAA